MRLLAVVLLAGCTTVADERARRDERVGHAVLGDARVDVDDGHAAVRRFAPGELVLWANAPTLRFTITEGEWDVTIQNLLPDAELDGGVLVEQRLPTEKRWTVTGPATLTLAPPDAADTAPFRFAVMADVQEALDEVQDIYAVMREDPTIRFVLMSGDLTRRGTVAQLECFQQHLESLPIPMYATLGNHELGERDDLFHDYFGRGNWRFVYRGVQVTALDSASATLAPRAHEWLDQWIAEGTGRFHVVMMHIPPLDPSGVRNGAFASRAEAHDVIGRLARGRVDVAFYGHLHSLYAYEEAGVPSFISGGGGAVPEQFDDIGRHFLTVDVRPAEDAFDVAVVRVD